MFSDTHFHLPLVKKINPDFNVNDFFYSLKGHNTFFAMDIGTRATDLKERYDFITNAFFNLPQELSSWCKKHYFFSAGIWPDVGAIKNRQSEISLLEKSITQGPSLAAIGECGIDHHWNPLGADGRKESDFTKEVYEGERELFLMQLSLAKKLKKPIVVHSRDAFADTYECIKESSYDRGIIHCFSYGLDEAKAFLDLGYYISFSGSVTYTKKSKIDSIKELLNFIPKDRILLETDSPYLAPVPFRGKINNPLLVEHTYNFVAELTAMSVEELSDCVDSNCKKLFLL